MQTVSSTSIEQTRECTRCHQEKPFSEFYLRAGFDWEMNPPTEAGHLVSHCKQCMHLASAKQTRIPLTEPGTPTEKLAIAYFRRHGYPALPGKAVGAVETDVAVWGHVYVEVKYARLKRHRGQMVYKFDVTPRQRSRGFCAHLLMLICDDGRDPRFYLFDKDDPVFYKDGHPKSGFTWRPGRQVGEGPGPNKNVLTAIMMQRAHDRLTLIADAMRRIENRLVGISD